MSIAAAQVTGVAAGVPFIAIPPITQPGASTPIVVAWHLMDPPRTETAFAAALPLRGLDAWRIYLGLPMCGSRTPPGGAEELMRLGYEDAVLNLHRPIISQAAEELGPALADLRNQFDLGEGPVGVLGGSTGSAVAQVVMAEGSIDVSAGVLVSPVVQLRPVVDALGRLYDITYPWSPASLEVAQRLDFVARAGDIAKQGRPAVLLVVGEDDDARGFLDPAKQLCASLTSRYGDSQRAELVVIPGMRHALAEEPREAAPQSSHAAAVDEHAVRWFQRHLIAHTPPFDQ